MPLPGLKHWRLRKRLSQKELARRAGLASHHLYKIESGKRGCNPETAQLSEEGHEALTKAMRDLL